MARARNLALLVVLLAGACATGPRGGPQQGAPEPSQILSPDALIFADFDADRDRRVTRAELDAGITAAWTAAAKSAMATSIGYIEWRDWLTKSAGAEFDIGPVGFDTDADLRITKDEFTTALTRRFTAMDANSDGVLDRGEFVRTVLGRGMGGMGPVRSGEAPQGGGGPPGGGPPGGGR